jgi:hypothetical protein
MMVNDRMEHERVDAKNALEVCAAPHDAIMTPLVCGPAREPNHGEMPRPLQEYVYESRDKLDGILSEYISESDKEAASAKLSATEDWLYDEGMAAPHTILGSEVRSAFASCSCCSTPVVPSGHLHCYWRRGWSFGSWLDAGRLTRDPIGAGEEEQKSVYVSKLGELKALVQPVQTRAQEWSELPAAEEALRTTIMRFRKVVDLHNAKVWMAPMPHAPRGWQKNPRPICLLFVEPRCTLQYKCLVLGLNLLLIGSHN